jgi:lactate dehydrogenase-like 2-hydroxyacid dehydrogenase
MAIRLKNLYNQISKPVTQAKELKRTMASSSNVSVAILDDYPGIAPKHFSRISGIKVDSFPETLQATKRDDLEALVKRLTPYQVISTMRERTAFPAELQKQLPNLKLLMTTGLKNASIDMKAASEQGITVTGTVGGKPKHMENYSTDDLPPPPQGNSVNQHSWALLLGLCGNIAKDDNALKTDSQAWQSGLAIPLGGKTLGLLGLGKLGTLMAQTGVQAFGMKAIAWSENLTQEKADAAAESVGLTKGTFKVVSKDELFKQADVVSVHLVLSDRSRGIVGQKELDMMKKSAIVVNTSRGGLIDEAAFLKALKEGTIRGAALDVYWEEPIPADSPWRGKDFKSEVVLSPHMGYANVGTMNRWYEEQAETLERWLKGEEVLHKLN